MDGSSESEEASASGRRSAMSMYSPFQIRLAGMGRDTELTITGEVVVGLPVALIAIVGTPGAP